MRHLSPFYRLIIATFALFFVAGCGSVPSLIVTVNFGTPPKGGGACAGKGICSAVLQPGAGTKVTLVSSPTDVLIMKFSMSELKNNQPDQVQNFTDGGTYAFDTTYSFTDQMYAPLKLPPNSRIEATTKSEIKIKGDVVVVTYHFEHDVQQ